jgi:hypothetical protein
MPTDKLLHLLVGISIAAILYPFGLIPAMVAVAVAAISKELWDKTGRGTPELLDAVATIAGGAALLGWYLVVQAVIL